MGKVRNESKWAEAKRIPAGGPAPCPRRVSGAGVRQTGPPAGEVDRGAFAAGARAPGLLEIEEENLMMERRQREFRLAAECVTGQFANLPEVEKVVLFGSVARKLEKEVPRFKRFRRAGLAIWHECKDVDLAVWVSSVDRLKELQRARSRALNELFEATEIGVAHHQVDVFLMEAGTDRYLGRLCGYGVCPKGKRECETPSCGAAPFLKQHTGFTWRPSALAAAGTVTLFDRAGRNDFDLGCPF